MPASGNKPETPVTLENLRELIAAGVNGRGAGSLVADKRLDRLILWMLTIGASAALSCGAWWARDIRTEIKQLNSNHAYLNTQVAVLAKSVESVGEIRDFFQEQQTLDREERVQLRLRIADLEKRMWKADGP